MLTTGNDTTLDAYRALEDRIRASDRDGLRARWEFGHALLAELGSRERLPNGRRDEIAKAVAIGRAEVNNRMQFAREYATEERLAHAVSQFGSWHEIVDRGLGNRGRRPTAATQGDPDDEVEGDEHDAYRIPAIAALREWATDVAENAHRADVVPGENRPGEHAVRALLEFFAETPEVPRLWEEWLARRAGLGAAAELREAA